MPATNNASSNADNQPHQDHRLAFLRGYFSRPKEVGSFIPSSRFIDKRIVNTAALKTAKLAVELGPGTGGSTKTFLKAMAPGRETPRHRDQLRLRKAPQAKHRRSASV